MKKQQKGFTLIELLVVIAIIGILATIVMVSLNSARAKAADATAKSNLRSVMTQSELVYDTTSSYAVVCADATVIKALDAASSAGAGNTTSDVCNNQAASWAASSPIKTSGFWCVDSVGNNKAEAATLPGATYVCP